MSTKVMSLSEFQTGTETILRDCCDSHETVVVELPDHRRVTIQSSDDDDLIDRLIETNAEFRELLRKSAAGPRHPFPFSKSE